MQMTRKARRIHVGNLPVGLGLTTQMVADEINKEMKKRGMVSVQPGTPPGSTNPVISVWINEASNYAFVEFNTVEEATAALTLDGQLSLMGQVLRFGRPADYVQPPVLPGGAAGYSNPLLLHLLNGAVPGVPGAGGGQSAKE